ncbi:MAG: transaldolase family protein [Burkholderiaceae bacterium]
MKIYLDSAHADHWALPAGCPSIAGVTTNPSLVHQAGLPVTLQTYERLVQAVAARGIAELMLQLPTADADDALRWQARLQALAQQHRVTLTIKLPCHPDWLPAIDAMRQAGQPVLLTGLSNPVQLLWARSLQATYVAPYVGRLAADGRDVWPLMKACVALQHSGGPALLAASIKSPDVLAQLIACGAAAVTLPPESLAAWSGDALTDTAIAQFARDTAHSLRTPDH